VGVYEVRQAVDTGIIRCSVKGFLTDSESVAFAAELLTKLSAARRVSSTGLRILFDNREGNVFSAKAADALNVLRSTHDPLHDRTAVLVANSVNKLQAKRTASQGTEIFLSEAAAITWLTAYDQTVPAKAANG
jgi:hypothetical protein